MTAADPQFLCDAARSILDASWDDILTRAEIVGLNVRAIPNSYAASGYGIKVTATPGLDHAARTWARKAKAIEEAEVHQMTRHALLQKSITEPLTAYERLTLARLEAEHLATIRASRKDNP